MREPSKFPAGVLALLVHVLFFGLLLFGVHWQSKRPAAVQADLWSALPTPQPAEQASPPKAEPKPELKPRPEPKVEVKPDVKPDIELQSRLEGERRQKEEQRKQEEQKQQAQRKKEEEERKQLALRQQEERRRVAEAQTRKELELERRQAQQGQLKARQNAEASANQRLLDGYIEQIRAHIKRNTQVPESVARGARVTVRIVVLPTGEVLEPIRVAESSGNKVYDDAVERGIIRSQPLPLPNDPEVRPQFRDLKLTFTHEK